MSRRAVGVIIAGSFAAVVVCAAGLFVLAAVRAVRDLPAYHAADQADIFEDMRSKALSTTDPAEIVGYLDYVESYYPSGSKHTTGSPLDRIVEGYRAAVIREIIGRLRAITGVDLGEQPRAWVEKYGKQKYGKQ
jgi:hypothetical protein